MNEGYRIGVLRVLCLSKNTVINFEGFERVSRKTLQGFNQVYG